MLVSLKRAIKYIPITLPTWIPFMEPSGGIAAPGSLDPRGWDGVSYCRNCFSSRLSFLEKSGPFVSLHIFAHIPCPKSLFIFPFPFKMSIKLFNKSLRSTWRDTHLAVKPSSAMTSMTLSGPASLRPSSRYNWMILSLRSAHSPSRDVGGLSLGMVSYTPIMLVGTISHIQLWT